MAPVKEAVKEDDWFEKLDAELEQQTQSIVKDMSELSNQKKAINRTLIEDFWKVLVLCGKINVHFTMEPAHSAFAQITTYPDEWKFKGFQFLRVNVSTGRQDAGTGAHR